MLHPTPFCVLKNFVPTVTTPLPRITFSLSLRLFLSAHKHIMLLPILKQKLKKNSGPDFIHIPSSPVCCTVSLSPFIGVSIFFVSMLLSSCSFCTPLLLVCLPYPLTCQDHWRLPSGWSGHSQSSFHLPSHRHLIHFLSLPLTTFSLLASETRHPSGSPISLALFA